MKPFLLELAESVYKKHARQPELVTLVFPNRRAALYFRQHFASLLDKPAFAPNLITIEDFISSFSLWQLPDKLQLISRLHKVYHEVLLAEDPAGHAAMNESFDQFYFWGEMLLSDFDELDKYMVSAPLLFTDLSHQKELDITFDFLTDDQRDFLRSFWNNFDEKESLNKSKFLATWRMIPRVYDAFRKVLREEGLAYAGMLHREVAQNIRTLIRDHEKYRGPETIQFAGFNALTKAEEVIMASLVEMGIATVHWDIDDYYFHNERQEAARFFRQYRQHPILGKTFPSDVPANLKSLGTVFLYGASQPVGQAKLLSRVLSDKLIAGEFNPEETLVVLPDEKLLMPVLHGLAASVEKLNVTMGFPLSSTPLFNFIELAIELQLNQKDNLFNHRAVVSLLGHPYVVAADPANAQAKRKEILYENRVFVSPGFLASQTELHRLIFVPFNLEDSATFSITGYLKKIIAEIGRLKSVTDFDREYAYHFILLLNRLEEVLDTSSSSGSTPGVAEPVAPMDKRDAAKAGRAKLNSFLRLFRQLIRGEKIPFRGEPLRGLQIMGVLETRNLDFKNVFILSLNEGSFPSFSSKGSYVPYNIRKAYGLPTVEQQDSMYAYLFYRVLQRAENVHLFYNTETDDLGQGEKSRYLQQLMIESGLKFEKRVLHNELRPAVTKPVQVIKDESVFTALENYSREGSEFKNLSPSALNDYLECRLKFYYRYVARIREPKLVEEDLDARILGLFLHTVLEIFYRDLGEKKGTSLVEENDFAEVNQQIDGIIDQAFIRHYKLDPNKKVVYEGQRVVVREIVKRFADRILRMDRNYAPFNIEALERRDMTYKVTVDATGSPQVVLGGSIDRVDRKQNQVRVIDYKTGKDSLSFKGIPSLFERNKDRNKAAFQTLLYTLLYRKNASVSDQVKLVPGLMNRLNLFSDDFTFGLQMKGGSLNDAMPLLPEFEEHLRKLLAEIYNPEIPFDQTKDTASCEYCPYSEICFR